MGLQLNQIKETHMRKEILLSEDLKSGGKVVEYVNDFKDQLLAAFEPSDHCATFPVHYGKRKRIAQTRMTANLAVGRMAAWWLGRGDYDRYNGYLDMLDQPLSRSCTLNVAEACEDAWCGNAAWIDGLYLEPFLHPFLPTGEYVTLRSDLEIECFFAVWDAAGKDFIEAWEDRFLAKEMCA
jgi:hypothetical protein